MNKRFLIVLAFLLLLIILVGVAVWMLLKPAAPANTNPNNPFGNGTQSGQTGIPATHMTIADAHGAPVDVPAFTSGRTPEAGSDGTNYYNLRHEGPTYGNEGDTFTVQFGEKDSSFVVLLQTEPLGGARKDAEAFLRSTLKLSDAQICKLNILVTVTPAVNQTYSEYENLGLSFCSGAVTLP